MKKLFSPFGLNPSSAVLHLKTFIGKSTSLNDRQTSPLLHPPFDDRESFIHANFHFASFHHGKRFSSQTRGFRFFSHPKNHFGKKIRQHRKKKKRKKKRRNASKMRLILIIIPMQETIRLPRNKTIWKKDQPTRRASKPRILSLMKSYHRRQKTRKRRSRKTKIGLLQLPNDSSLTQ